MSVPAHRKTDCRWAGGDSHSQPLRKSDSIRWASGSGDGQPGLQSQTPAFRRSASTAWCLRSGGTYSSQHHDIPHSHGIPDSHGVPGSHGVPDASDSVPVAAATPAAPRFRFDDRPQRPYNISGRSGSTHYEQLTVSFSLEAHLAEGGEAHSSR